MNSRFILPAVCVIAFAVGSGRAATFSGTLTNDTRLTGTNVVLGTVVVTNGVVLTVEAGTRVMMSTGAALVVYGQLLAHGTSNAPIYFTREVLGQQWKQIQFVNAMDSVLRHCFIEYANSAGTHLEYYDNDCNGNTPPPARSYHEAVVALATRLELDGCTFRNLPDSRAGAEGDALAIVSDDPQWPGPASALISNCRFLSIGQGVHARFSHVRIENCFFTGHNGDNDDVDLYGESSPPPLIRNNVFLNPAHDDAINPTRCSAVIVGNVMSGGDDHGIVLRDQCSPIVINNVIYNFASGGIAVQNQCDALIANNTIVNCGRGIRFFDHDQRWGPPYCLVPGSGRATIINCIIWDCPTSFLLEDSPDTGNPGSHVSVLHCNVEGGLATATVEPNSILAWGPGNISADPQFVNRAANDYHLRTNSPCIDAGTNVTTAFTNAVVVITNDFEGVPRALDGNNDGLTWFDVGAYEQLQATADSNADGIPDGWTWNYGLDPTDSHLAMGNPDGDAHTTFQEWVADTDPTNALSSFGVEAIAPGPPITLQFSSSSNRYYTLVYTTNLASAPVWRNVPGQVGLAGRGGWDSLTDTNVAAEKFYRIQVNTP